MKIKTFDDIVNGKAPELREKYFNFSQSCSRPGGPVAHVVGAGSTTAYISSMYRAGSPVFFLNPRDTFWMERTPGNPIAIISGHHTELVKNCVGFDCITFKTRPAPYGNGRIAGVFLDFLCKMMGSGTVTLSAIDFDDDVKKDRSPDAANINAVIDAYMEKINFLNFTSNFHIKSRPIPAREMVLDYAHLFDFGANK